MAEQVEQFINIPYSIMRDEKLSQTQKMIYGMVRGYMDSGSIFYASNKYISEIVMVKERSVSHAIAYLVEHKYLAVYNPKGRGRSLVIYSSNHAEKCDNLAEKCEDVAVEYTNLAVEYTNLAEKCYPTTQKNATNNIVDNINNTIVDNKVDNIGNNMVEEADEEFFKNYVPKPGGDF